MKFNDLIARAGAVGVISGGADIEIRHICCDSRAARLDSVFVCIKGAVADGHLYARAAYNLGCRAFVAEHRPDLPRDAMLFISDNTRLALAKLSDALYDHPSRRIKVIGITGTKGKTTTSLMIAGILNKCGVPTGYIGSNGVEYRNFRHLTSNTTPESCDLQRTFADMASAGMKYVALEVSSQALYLDRVRCIEFDTCVFTNLSPDHIGGVEHPSFEHYKASKASLFTEYKLGRAVVNSSDPASADMLGACDCDDVENFGLGSRARHTAENIMNLRRSGSLGVSFDYICGSYRKNARIALPGEFNIENALAAFAVCGRILPSFDAMVDALSDIRAEGRFELVEALPYATIVIDYAHNRTSLYSVLKTLRSYNPRRLICLFGSVGGRTVRRRAELGAVASELCDISILTADNPDCEDPALIIRDIAASFVPGGSSYISIPDRAEAIRYAVGIIGEGDILLLAGKGHENYQLVKGIKKPFCERQIVLEAAEAIHRTPV